MVHGLLFIFGSSNTALKAEPCPAQAGYNDHFTVFGRRLSRVTIILVAVVALSAFAIISAAVCFGLQLRAAASYSSSAAAHEAGDNGRGAMYTLEVSSWL